MVATPPPSSPRKRVVSGKFLVLICLLVILAVAFGVTVAVSQLLHAGKAKTAPSQLDPERMMAALSRETTSDVSRGMGITAMKPLLGQPAPDFTLPGLQDPTPVQLSRLRDKPVVLALSSFTCDVFCGHAPGLEQLYQEYKGRAHFLFVAISDPGHEVPGMDFLLDAVDEVKDLPVMKRRELLKRAMGVVKLTVPGAIDQDRVAERAYTAYPLRLVGVDRSGKVGLDLGIGIFDRWDLGRVGTWLQAEMRK